MQSVSIQPLLLFINLPPVPCMPRCLVSIQPLLLFIEEQIRRLLAQNSFNTTLVTVYQRTFGSVQTCWLVSIQPLLLFILARSNLLVRLDCFNTTLVTVYRNNIKKGMVSPMFQYNPCYCLSIRTKQIKKGLILVSIQPLLLFIAEFSKLKRQVEMFQYNPCYCLSLSAFQLAEATGSFNTTLVTVYRERSSGH